MTSEATNRKLFIASFLTLIAAGMGFAIRGGILGEWEQVFGFTKSELGLITGGGLAGFGVTIIICSLFADRIGYKTLMLLAFVLHIASGVVTLAATSVYAGDAANKDKVFWCLNIGMWLFALANGVCEAVINPLTATLYPKQKTHYLNILHAGWPGGLILGGVLAYFFVGPEAKVARLQWEIPMAFFLIPTLLYGLMMLKEPFPISEAKAAGVSFEKQLSMFAHPVLILLLVLHALVGYVELGTDSWITDIMKGEIKSSILLLIYTSGIMFVLRFFAGPIVEKINPVGLLFITSILGCIGLYWLGNATGAAAVFAAATVYGVGKTFLWPTMLGVVGERFPQGGALTMGVMGGIGMLSAGFLGGPGIGYKQDYYASNQLKTEHAVTYERYKAKDPNHFLLFPEIVGLDGQKVGALKDKLGVIEKKTEKNEPLESKDQLTAEEQSDQGPVLAAGKFGGQMALKLTAIVPALMAVGYLILLGYFRAQGGYKAHSVHGGHH